MRTVRWGGALALAACSFDASGLGAGGNPDAMDGSTDGSGMSDVMPGFDGPQFMVPHVPTGGSFGGIADLALSTSVIDTGALTIAGAPAPSGTSFDTWPQTPSGPELAVLHVRAFSVVAGATVSVTGPRPLVIIAAGDVRL